jgi:hypothetical protein
VKVVSGGGGKTGGTHDSSKYNEANNAQQKEYVHGAQAYYGGSQRAALGRLKEAAATAGLGEHLNACMRQHLLRARCVVGAAEEPLAWTAREGCACVVCEVFWEKQQGKATPGAGAEADAEEMDL